jgi:nucleotide-binding universal stress UspA family protein
MTMKKILLPLDGSECSEAAIPVAKRLAEALKGTIVLVTIGNLPESAAMEREERQALSDMLSRIESEHGLRAEAKMDLIGDAAEGILRVADDVGADIIVMATHGRSGLSELAQGSVASQVVRDGRKPVMLVRPKS